LLCLTIAAWLLVFVGVLGSVGIIFLPVALVVFAMAAGRYRDMQRRALLWSLAISAERGLPLAPAARAFAAGRADEIGRRGDRLADLLEAGVALPEALGKSGNRLPIEAELAARLNQESGDLVQGLREAARAGSLYLPLWQSLFERFLYLVVLLLVFGIVQTFLMIKIVPTLVQIFEDFDASLPRMTEVVIGLSEWAAAAAVLAGPLYMLVIAVLLLGTLYYMGWLPWELPVVDRLTRRLHGSHVLRCLAQATERGRPMSDTLGLLARCYPRANVQRLLTGVAEQVARGNDWSESLRQSGLIGTPDAAVLKAAQRVGNLPWALREMADSNARRIFRRGNAALQIGFPLVILCVAVVVGCWCVALFYPLVQLIHQAVP
jgi:type II secretory pathway component PulF